MTELDRVGYRATTASVRTTDYLQSIDLYAREALGEPSAWLPNDPAAGELLALRHLAECLTRIVQAHPLIGEFAESFAAEAAAALRVGE